MVDCGAIDNLAGQKFVDRQGEQAKAVDEHVKYVPLDRPMEVNGVGRGSQRATHEAVVPIHIDGEIGEYRAPILTGDGSHVPGLWGLRSQRQKRALIDTGGNCVLIPGPGGFTVKLSPGSKIIKCENAVSGHMMIPVSDFLKQNSKGKNYDSKKWILYGSVGEPTSGTTASSSSSTMASTVGADDAS